MVLVLIYEATASLLNCFCVEIERGLPSPKEFIGQEGNSKVILVLRLHQVLNDARELVQYEVEHMDEVDKTTMQINNY